MTTKGEAILEALRGHGPLSPADLAKRMKLARPALMYHMKTLVTRGAVIATGTTMHRQFSLPPRGRAAKEEP